MDFVHQMGFRSLLESLFAIILIHLYLDFWFFLKYIASVVSVNADVLRLMRHADMPSSAHAKQNFPKLPCLCYIAVLVQSYQAEAHLFQLYGLWGINMPEHSTDCPIWVHPNRTIMLCDFRI